jgi:hypothetical protein
MVTRLTVSDALAVYADESQLMRNPVRSAYTVL